MLKRDEWLDLARKLDWELSYVARGRGVPARSQSGRPWLPHAAWADWDEPYRTTYAEYVDDAAREGRVGRTRCARRSGRLEDYQQLPPALAERRSSCTPRRCRSPSSRRSSATCARARFGRDSAWRTSRAARRARRAPPHADPAAAHARARALGPAVRLDARSTTSNNWVAIAARHLVDELLLGSRPDRVRDRDQLRVRDRLHQPAVRRAVVAGARRRRPDVREDGAAASRPTRRATRRSAAPVLAIVVAARPRVRAVPASTSGSGAAGCSSRS